MHLHVEAAGVVLQQSLEVRPVAPEEQHGPVRKPAEAKTTPEKMKLLANEERDGRIQADDFPFDFLP